MDWKEGKIVNTPLERQMKTSYIDYAMSVILTRAPPAPPPYSVRDERSGDAAQ